MNILDRLPRVTLQSSYSVDLPIETVFDYLSDPQQFAGTTTGQKVEMWTLDADHIDGRAGYGIWSPVSPLGRIFRVYLEVDRPSLIVIETWSDAEPRRGRVTLRLEPTVVGTIVRDTTELPLNARNMLSALVWPVWRMRGGHKQIGRMRASIIERWAAHRPSAIE